MGLRIAQRIGPSMPGALFASLSIENMRQVYVSYVQTIAGGGKLR
jgi:hypothetical protein